jgi:voltage-gated potassium channel
MRMLKLTRYSSAIQTLGEVVKREWPVIFSSMFVLLLLVVITASLGYMLEHDAQPEVFSNIPEAIYWAMTTLSSIGYGDMTPVTPIGRMVTVVVALIGVGIFAIPAGLLASAFTDQLQLDREAFKARIMQLMEKGPLSADDTDSLELEAARLHISMQTFHQLLEDVRNELVNLRNATFAQDSLVFSALDHPEYAARQFQTLVHQLDFLVKSAEKGQLERDLLKRFGENSEEIKLFMILRNADQTN